MLSPFDSVVLTVSIVIDDVTVPMQTAGASPQQPTGMLVLQRHLR